MASFRPKPNEVSMMETKEISVTDSVPTTLHHSYVSQSSQTEQSVNKELLQSLQDVYSPLLKTMKFFGAYFGNTTFDRLMHGQIPELRRKTSCVSPLFCGVIVAGLWFNFAMGLVSIFFGGPTYLFLLIDMWCLLVAVNGILCLIVLPLTDMRKSRFEKFITNVSLLTSDGINLEKIKEKKRKCLMLFSFFLISAAVGIVLIYAILGVNFGLFGPWEEWFGFRLISLLFLVIGCGFWLLPIILFCLTCTLLEALFDDLNKRFPSSQTIDISALRMEHSKLCEIVGLADGVLSALILMFVGLCIPFICFALHQMVNLPEEDKLLFIIVDMFWILASAVTLAVVMIFGSRVNEKIHSLQKISRLFPVLTDDQGKMLMFMMYMLDLQGEPKGLSVGGLTVITKSLSLTIVGVIVSYFAVMLSLPSSFANG